MITKPLLAATPENLNDIKFPVLVTPKLDGIRCLKVGGRALSRTFKPLPNKYVASLIEAHCPDGFDGEIMAGTSFSESQSLIMSAHGEPSFAYAVFDFVKDDLRKPYRDRINDLIENGQPPFGYILLPVLIQDTQELLSIEAQYLDIGHEGLMIRAIDGPYKCGHSTVKEGFLLKLKRFMDSEAVVIGFHELLHNTNEPIKNAVGNSKRSSAKAGKIASGLLGSMLVRDIKTGVQFNLGGFDRATAKAIWTDKESYLGKLAKYKYQGIGSKEKPRIPTFLGWRHPDDI